MGADVIDINMGCPVPKIAKHNAGCSLMREPAHAASVVRAMTNAVRIPVTVKMRAGWNEREINAPTLARMVEDAGAAAIAVHGRTAAQSYTGESDWSLIARVAESVSIPVFGSGDCVEAEHIVDRLANHGVGGVLVGRGALRNPWIFSQASAAGRGEAPAQASREERGQFLLDYVDLLLAERVNEAEGFPPRGAVQASHGCRPPWRSRAGKRAVGHQQAPCALFLVHQGIRGRVSAASLHQLGGVDRPAARDYSELLSGSSTN
jgi:tRNA-dihydrouridine synthase B